MLKTPAQKAASEYLTPPEIAVLLGVAHQKILNWIEAGELRAVDVSTRRRRKRWKIARADLEKFIEGRSNRPRPLTARQRHQEVRGETYY